MKEGKKRNAIYGLLVNPASTEQETSLNCETDKTDAGFLRCV